MVGAELSDGTAVADSPGCFLLAVRVPAVDSGVPAAGQVPDFWYSLAGHAMILAPPG